MASPTLVRMVAFGPPAAMAQWRRRTIGLYRSIHADLSTVIKLTAVRVDAGPSVGSITLAAVATLGTHEVHLLALWQDALGDRRWVYAHDGRITTLDVPGGEPVDFILAHAGRFRRLCQGASPAPTAAEVLARMAWPSGNRWRSMVFDVDGPWAPQSHPAPKDTCWSGAILDASDLYLGRHLGTHPDQSRTAWSPWAVDLLRTWLAHEQLRACDAAATIAATAGLPPADLAPALVGCSEPAADVVTLVRALAEQGLAGSQICDALPGLLAR